MRTEHVERQLVTPVEVACFAEQANVQLAWAKRPERDSQLVLDARRPVELGVNGAIVPLALTDEIVELDRLVGANCGVPIVDEGMFVHMAHEYLPAVRDLGTVRDPPNPPLLWVAFVEGADVRTDDSVEAMHHHLGIGIEGLACVQLFDEFRDRAKVAFAQARHTQSPASAVATAIAVAAARVGTSSFARIRSTQCLIVIGDRPRMSAMSRLVLPPVSQARTSVSRGLRPSEARSSGSIRSFRSLNSSDSPCRSDNT